MSDQDAINEQIKKVARHQDGTLKVFSPYGFKIDKVDGEDCLVALTLQEAEEFVTQKSGAEAAKAIAAGGCLTPGVGAFCVNTGCSGACVMVFKGRWACVCRKKP